MAQLTARIITRFLVLAVILQFFSCSSPSTRQTLTGPKKANTIPSDAVAWIPANGTALEVLSNRTVTLVGNARIDSGFVGQALQFDGLGSVAALPDSERLDLDSSLSIVCWAKLDVALALQPNFGAYSHYPFLAEKGNGSFPARNYGLYFDQAKNGLDFNGVNAMSTNYVFEVKVDSASRYFDDLKWHLVAATWDRRFLSGTIYVDGQPMASATGVDQDLLVNTYPLMIGAGYYDRYFFDGGVDELMIFSRALSQSEILEIFNAGHTGCVQ